MNKKELERLVIKTRIRQIDDDIDFYMDCFAQSTMPQYAGNYLNKQEKLIKERKGLIKEMKDER